MTTTTENTTREKHLWELEPRVGEQRRTMIAAGVRKGNSVPTRTIELVASEIFEKWPEVTALGLYHTYPNAGPQRRYVKEIPRPE